MIDQPRASQSRDPNPMDLDRQLALLLPVDPFTQHQPPKDLSSAQATIQKREYHQALTEFSGQFTGESAFLTEG